MSIVDLREVFPNGQPLVVEKLELWERMVRFIEMNPDIKERWEQHKTYEILKDEHIQR